MTTAEDTDRAKSQAQAQLESIKELAKDLEDADAGTNEDARDEARQAIHEDPLSVEVRSGWHTPGGDDDSDDGEYRILLCTGGPAVRIIGSLSPFAEPDSAHIEYQDWGTPNTSSSSPLIGRRVQLDYARTFYFGS